MVAATIASNATAWTKLVEEKKATTSSSARQNRDLQATA